MYIYIIYIFRNSMKKQRSVLMKQIAINDSLGSVLTSSDQVTSEGEICITGVTRYKCPMDMTQEELKEFIKNGGREACNKVMGVASCGDDQSARTGAFSTWSPYNRWYMSGGRCPLGNLIESNLCTTGCKIPPNNFGSYGCW